MPQSDQVWVSASHQLKEIFRKDKNEFDEHDGGATCKRDGRNKSSKEIDCSRIFPASFFGIHSQTGLGNLFTRNRLRDRFTGSNIDRLLDRDLQGRISDRKA
jgi:hypothetical protein